MSLSCTNCRVSRCTLPLSQSRMVATSSHTYVFCTLVHIHLQLRVPCPYDASSSCTSLMSPLFDVTSLAMTSFALQRRLGRNNSNFFQCIQRVCKQISNRIVPLDDPSLPRPAAEPMKWLVFQTHPVHDVTTLHVLQSLKIQGSIYYKPSPGPAVAPPPPIGSTVGTPNLIRKSCTNCAFDIECQPMPGNHLSGRPEFAQDADRQ